MRKERLTYKGHHYLIIFIALFAFLPACSSLEDNALDDPGENYEAIDDLFNNDITSVDITPGLMTAGEWKDLENWDFWLSLMDNPSYTIYQQQWGIYPTKRYHVNLRNEQGQALIDIQVHLLNEDEERIWSAKTDNSGIAELWVNLYAGNDQVGGIEIIQDDASTIINEVQAFSDGLNEIILKDEKSLPNALDVAFVVDATGSMSDELDYLKAELDFVMEEVGSSYPELEIRLGSIFYRDIGDSYTTQLQDFSTNIFESTGFLAQQSAAGGGDYPEAVDIALNKAQQLDWSEDARARILFLVLDAPPHGDEESIQSIRNDLREFAAKGIKLIPVAASGINTETEFLMRFLAISSNGTYTFITDDSGIGNDHLEPTVGEYQIELLNEMLARLISDYCKY